MLLPLMQPTPPTYGFDFLRNPVLPYGMTFTRASAGTYFDVNGNLVSAANDVPRFEYDPVTHAPIGLLLEGSRTNMSPYTKAVTGTVVNTGITSSYDTTDTLDPKGTNEADKITADATSSTHLITATSIAFLNTTQYTLSVFVKAGTVNRVQTTGGSGVFGTGQYANFSLVGAGSVLASLGCTAAILQCSNGWYRLSMTMTSIAATSVTAIAVGFINSDTAARIPTFLAEGTETLYVWGFQVEAAPSASSVIITTGAAATRAADSLSTTSIPWFNPNEGTLFVDFVLNTIDSGGLNYITHFSDGTTNNYITSFLSGATRRPQGRNAVAGSLFTSADDQTAIVINGTTKIIRTYKSGNNSFASNGIVAGVDTLGAAGIPAGVTRLDFANRPSGSYFPILRIRSFKYWNRALSDAELTRITT